ncbi:MAG: hypothetical protein ACE5HL_12925 [Terriglobia bacterium]
MHRTAVFFLVAFTLLLAGSAHSIDRAVFKQKAKIPYALQAGSQVVKPGEYIVEIGLEGTKWILTLYSRQGKGVLRTVGHRKERLGEDPSLGEGKLRLKIMPLPDVKRPGKKVVVFMCDENFRGRLYQIIFRVPEAAK